MSDEKREMLRHTVATLAYRARKALAGAPQGFEGFCAGETSRSAGQILAHMGDLLDWAYHLAQGKSVWRDGELLAWEAGVERFFASLERFDALLATGAQLGTSCEELFQGPIADALTHTGQISLLRRLAGGAVRGENYYVAKIVTGRVGMDQEAPRREFD